MTNNKINNSEHIETYIGIGKVYEDESEIFAIVICPKCEKPLLHDEEWGYDNDNGYVDFGAYAEGRWNVNCIECGYFTICLIPNNYINGKLFNEKSCCKKINDIQSYVDLKIVNSCDRALEEFKKMIDGSQPDENNTLSMTWYNVGVNEITHVDMENDEDHLAEPKIFKELDVPVVYYEGDGIYRTLKTKCQLCDVESEVYIGAD